MIINTEPLFEIIIYSHFFKITNLKPRAIQLVLKFCLRYVLMGFSKTENNKHGNSNKLVPLKVFASKVKDYEEFRFHIGQLRDFYHFLDMNFVTTDLYNIREEKLFTPVKIDVKINPGWILKDYQSEAKEFILCKDLDDNRSRLVSLRTGLGKTVISLSSIAELKTRTIIIILSSYIDKWCSDIVEILNVKPKEIMPIQGTNQLKGLIQLAIDDELTSKFIVISLSTIKNFFKTYEQYGKTYTLDDYGCLPEDLCKITETGALLLDEVHQHFHGIFKTLLYTHVQKVIGMSATFISDDPMIKNIQKLVFPKEITFDKIVSENYAKVRAVSYSFYDINRAKIRTTQFRSNTYSHTEFEKSILRNKTILFNYLLLIDSLVISGYLATYIKGDKLAIFAASIKMCDVITTYLKNKYNHLDIRRYVEDDPYENVIEPDIRVSTILSSGTAIDIPGLRYVIMTTNIKSPVSNLQTLGRLRKLKDRDVVFYYIYCSQIPKHVEYHKSKLELFENKVSSIKELNSSIFL